MVYSDTSRFGQSSSTLLADIDPLAVPSVSLNDVSQFKVVGADTQVDPDGSKAHHSQLGHLVGLNGDELDNEAGLISKGRHSSSFPSLQQEPEKEIAIQSHVDCSLQHEPEEEVATQSHVDDSSVSL
ncbi:hypothetical protein V6N13_027608 [Hibiscus sabdariffa]